MSCSGRMNEQELDKEMHKYMGGGCIAGFFNLFDRNHLLSTKRIYTKRLSASSFLESDSVSSIRSPAPSFDLDKPEPAKSAPSPEHLMPPPTTPPPPVVSSPARSPVAVTSFELKEGLKSPWKFSREAPRLSLDSQAVVDAKGKLRPRELRTTAAEGGGRYVNNGGVDESDNMKRSPSVIARLMGLDQPLPSCQLLEKKKVELRRSASESRSRDTFRFVDGNAFANNESNGAGEYNNNNNIDNKTGYVAIDQIGYVARSANTEAAKPWTPPQHQQRNGLYDAGDFFPEPKRAVTICSEIERRLKMRGIDEPSKDLETLKQIFEALQLRGLLHSKQPPEQFDRRNFVYERRFPHEESPIVVMKTARSLRRIASTEPSPPPGFRSKALSRQNHGGSDPIPSVSPRRDGLGMSRNQNNRSPARSENRSTSPVTTRKKLNVETQRRKNETTAEPRRVSPVQSPRVGLRRNDQVANQSPRRSRPTAEDQSSAISESSSISTSSQNDIEGKYLLERCDKLLNSIAEITATRPTTITELQPSPVSVLDSSFYKEESSPSPVMKRTIDFKDRVADLEDETWSTSSSGGAFQSKSSDIEDNTDDQKDPDFVYVSEILRVSNYLPDDSDIFLLLEKQQSITGRDASKTSRLRRKLIFDFVIEILDRHRQLPPWKSTSSGPKVRHVWSELQRIHVRTESEDLFEVICGVMKRDMAGDSIHGWGECHVDMSEAVLDIERLIFKDLVGETIHSLAAVARENGVILASRRKLIF